MKKSSKLWLILSSLIFVTVGALSSVAYLIYSNWSKGSIIIRGSKGNLDINILEIEDNMSVSNKSFKEITYDPNFQIQDKTKKLLDDLNKNSANWIKDEYFSYKMENNVLVLVYTDPINGVKFKDHSYGTYKKTLDSENESEEILSNEADKNEEVEQKPRFLLGKEGLALLANHFYAKQTFGPEIMYLDSININDARVSASNANGLYTPSTKTIFLNGSFVAEKGYEIDQKVKFLIPVLFHEYMHHWANSYVNYYDYNDQFIPVSYRQNHSKARTINYFYKEFYNGFKTYLNFAEKPINANENEWLDSEKNFIGRILTTQELFALGNSNNAAEYQSIYSKISSFASLYGNQEKITFKYKKNELNKYVISEYSPQDLPYYYSIVELIPREWTKFAYKPYYSVMYETPAASLNDKGYYLSQNYFATAYLKNGEKSTYFSNNTYVQDWARTNNNGMPISDKTTNIQTFENNIWNYIIAESKEPVYKEFYKMFLKSMGFGKLISQMKSRTEWSFISGENGTDININTDNNVIGKVSLTGYLDSSKYKALVFVKDNVKKIVNINYVPLIRFNSFNKPQIDEKIHSNQILRPSDVLDNINNLTNKNDYIAYKTDEFDIKNYTGSYIYLWEDVNNNNQIENSELIKQFTDPLPDRPIINSDSKEYINPNASSNISFSWPEIVEADSDQDGFNVVRIA
ncbi:MYPU_1760 family metalloprotease [Mycoplasmopsis iners]|uniref:MYPU_1760 family metalloprotease n=1 Tax=Mycoplasmopsis iners TaxID=76630 RepID=UPI0004956BE8|nr:hypothetical protein [Mycoplasmopsis iners]